MGRRMVGKMGWIDRRTERLMDGDGWMDGWIEQWVNGWKDGSTGGGWIYK